MPVLVVFNTLSPEDKERELAMVQIKISHILTSTKYMTDAV